MLDAMDGDDLHGVVDTVDDPVVATSSREEPGELSHERLTQAVRIVCYRAVERHQGGVSDLGGKLVQVAEPLWRDPDLVHPFKLPAGVATLLARVPLSTLPARPRALGL